MNRENDSDRATSSNCLLLRKVYIFFIATFFFAATNLIGQKPLPELWGLHVHDEAHVLTQPFIDQLEKQLKEYQDSTSNEIAVLLISSLGGETLEEYSLQVSEKWQLGKKEKDNGALLLIVVDDHKMRIETGQGLEGVLTDAVCSRIIRNELAPHFRQDNYEAGARAGISAMIHAIGGEYTAEEDDSGNPELGLKERILIGLFVFGILGIFTVLGLFIPGCGGWFLYAFLIPFYAAFPLVVLGTSGGLLILGIYLIAFPVLKFMLGKSEWGSKMARKMATTSGSKGRWSSGSGWSAGSGGGRSSGGFSGGGGSFSGGGSSGSW